VTVGDVPTDVPGQTLFRSGSVWHLTADGNSLWMELFRAGPMRRSLRVLRFEPDTEEGRLTVSPVPHGGLTTGPDGHVVAPFGYPLLQLLVYWELAKVGGAGFHASGVALDDRGCLFVGVSGAGKTTITHLCLEAGASVLSDDRVGLNRRDGRFLIFGTPWHGTPDLARPACAALSAVFFLEHAPRNEAIPLSGAQACAELVARAFPPYFSRQLMEQAIATCAEVAETIPCYRLRFVPDASAVDLVRGALQERR